MKHPILILTLLAALVRVVFVAQSSPDQLRYPDAQEYVDIARHVAAGQGFVTRDGRMYARGPGYPLFLAAHLAVFGDRELPMRATQALLGALVVPLAWALARRVASPLGATLAALYVALDPFLVYFTGLLLVETLYTLLLGLQVLLLFRLAESRRLSDAVWLGLAAAAATLLHAGHLAALGLIVLAWPLLVPKGEKGHGRWALLAAYVVAAAGLMSLWIARNLELSGRLIPVTAKLGRDLYDSNGPGATGGAISESVLWPKDLPKEELARDDALLRAVMKVVRDEPGRVLGLVPSKFGRFWSPVPNYERFRTQPYLTVALLASVPLLGLGLLGVCLLARRNMHALKVLLFFPVVVCMVHLVFLGSVRYRIPLHPVLVGIAAVGIERVARRGPDSGNRLDA